MPRPNAGLLGRLLGGTPVQYILIDHSDLNPGHVTTPDLQISVAGGTPQVTAGSAGSWIGFVRQDRICRDPRAWVDDLDAAAGTEIDPTWTSYGARVRSLVPPTVRLVDHRGRPLSGGSFTVTTVSGPDQTVTLSRPDRRHRRRSSPAPARSRPQPTQPTPSWRAPPPTPARSALRSPSARPTACWPCSSSICGCRRVAPA